MAEAHKPPPNVVMYACPDGHVHVDLVDDGGEIGRMILTPEEAICTARALMALAEALLEAPMSGLAGAPAAGRC